jgi:hypothetical protein
MVVLLGVGRTLLVRVCDSTFVLFLARLYEFVDTPVEQVFARRAVAS